MLRLRGQVERRPTVRYVRWRWGRHRLKAWMVALAAVDLTDQSIELVTRERLGVAGKRFIAGWRAFVLVRL